MIVHWATDVYVFAESQITGTVELVTDSTFEVAQVIIQGFSRQIPDGDTNRIDSLVVLGPALPGMLMRSNSLHCVIFTLDTSICSFQMYTHLCYYAYNYNSFVEGFAFSATIERAFVRVPARLFGDRIFGNAQLTSKILRIDHTKKPKLICCLHLSMQSLVAVMLRTQSVILSLHQTGHQCLRTLPLLMMMCWNLMRSSLQNLVLALILQIT